MKAPSITIIAAAIFGAAALVGCTNKSSLELTPEQQAEVDKSIQDAKKRGWIKLTPLTADAKLPALDGSKADESAVGAEAVPAKDSAAEDPFAGSGLPENKRPPTK